MNSKGYYGGHGMVTSEMTAGHCKSSRFDRIIQDVRNGADLGTLMTKYRMSEADAKVYVAINARLKGRDAPPETVNEQRESPTMAERMRAREEVIRRYAEGESVGALSADLHFGHVRIMSWLEEAGMRVPFGPGFKARKNAAIEAYKAKIRDKG